jgi:hypothetical protein
MGASSLDKIRYPTMSIKGMDKGDAVAGAGAGAAGAMSAAQPYGSYGNA